jgi:hypothetical protein
LIIEVGQAADHSSGQRMDAEEARLIVIGDAHLGGNSLRNPKERALAADDAGRRQRMPLITWNSSYSVKVKRFDADHQHYSTSSTNSTTA